MSGTDGFNARDWGTYASEFWWGTYVVTLPNGDTGIGCGECKWTHRLPTPFLEGDAARIAIDHHKVSHPHKVILRRLRLPLDSHNSDLLLVGDTFDNEGGQYVQHEVPRAESEGWSWLDWDIRYDILDREWHALHGKEE